MENNVKVIEKLKKMEKNKNMETDILISNRSIDSAEKKQYRFAYFCCLSGKQIIKMTLNFLIYSKLIGIYFDKSNFLFL